LRRVDNLYLDLLEQTLTGLMIEDVGIVPGLDPEPAKSFDKKLGSTEKIGRPTLTQ